MFSFNGTKGSEPQAGLVQATDGSLYGTTKRGGANDAGTIFKIVSGGSAITLYDFCSQPKCQDGRDPEAGLIQATDGNFYGTTYLGGSSNRGTVFSITPSGALTVLYSFCAQAGCADGQSPTAALVQAPSGTLYSTTYSGGAYNRGTVFSMTTSGALTTLYSFCAQTGCPDGSGPVGGFVQGASGFFYGTTEFGGANQSGTAYQITQTGTFTQLYNFCNLRNCADGAGPTGVLIQYSGGNFYGTTAFGGDKGVGTVFEMTSAGVISTLHSFCSSTGCTDGQYPYAGLVQATDGNLYGTAEQGGAQNGGVIFSITPGGLLSALYSFCSQGSGCSDGYESFAGLAQDTDGSFYGTTGFGGANGYGEVFNLSTGLSPFIETQTSSGKVGQTVVILGTNLTGATGVSFNGAAASFTVASSSEITTIVPARAKSGAVTVVTPGGTFASKVNFYVVP